MILVVDDHEEFRTIIKQILRSETDLPVEGEAGDGMAAVEYVRHHHPGVVVMDVAMPRLDGFDATRRIKAMRPDTKVLILTVHTEEGYPERARDSGADRYLPKQNVITELIPAIRQMLGEPSAETAD